MFASELSEYIPTPFLPTFISIPAPLVIFELIPYIPME